MPSSHKNRFKQDNFYREDKRDLTMTKISEALGDWKIAPCTNHAVIDCARAAMHDKASLRWNIRPSQDVRR